MEEQRNQLNPEPLCCSICKALLKNPVTIPCGHSYCKVCIEGHWKTEDEKNIYSCPQCRKTFRPRPDLVKDIMLTDIVEKLKKTRHQAAPAGAEDVACDVCTKRKLKSVKSCLVCLASYCEEHLQPHYQSPPLKKHKLMEPSKNLQENICSVHDEVMKMFCRTDQQCICYLCSVDQHKGHDIMSAAAATAERTQRQREVELSLQEIQQRVQDREKDLKELQQEVEAANVSADKAVEDSGKIFTEMICLLEKRSSDVKQWIRSQQEREVRGVKDVEVKLQQEITELKWKEAELKQLSQTQDHNQFIFNCPSLSALRPSPHSSSIHIRPLRRFEDVTEAVSKVRGQLQDVLTGTWTKITKALRLGPQTRAEFLQYSQEITLDPNTAHSRLLLSAGNRKVTLMSQGQIYPPHPDRFTGYYQVLSRKSLSGRCYWEVEWRRGGGVFVAVTYKDINRTGKSDECLFGPNDKSWSLYFNKNSTFFFHNKIRTKVSAPGSSSRVGVYLDHRAGLLSFYTVSDSMTLLHRVQTTFTQPLYAGVNMYNYPGTTAEFCKLRQT